MALTEIDIERRLPVINGFVQVPDKQITGRTSVTLAEANALIPGSDSLRVGESRIVDQLWLKLPAFDRFADTQPPSDFFGILKGAV